MSTLFHGTNRNLELLHAGSWVTEDSLVAFEFAEAKTAQEGGTPIIYAVELETPIAWDFIGMVTGVDDMRGTTLEDAAVTVIPMSGPAHR